MKKGPVCYIYYAIKNKRQLKIEQEKAALKSEELTSQAEIYNSHY